MSHVDEGTLHAYFDGELPPTERVALETHLAQCEACRARLLEERALLERSNALLGATRPLERPLPALEQLRREPKRSPWRVRTSVAWAASLALALGLGYYLNDVSPRSAPSASMETGRIVAAAPPQPAPPLGYSAAPRAPGPAPALPAPTRVETRAERTQRLGSQESAERDQQQSRSDEAGMPNPGRVALRDAPRAGPSSTAKAAAPVPQFDTVSGSIAAVPSTMRAGLQRQDVLAERKVSANLWPRIDRETAKTILGEDPVGLPDLTTRTYRRSPDRDGVVLVEQQLDDRTVIQIFQQQTARANARFDSLVAGARGAPIGGFDRERADRLARFVGKLRVEIGGPVSVDSLNRLLEQIGRLP